MTFVGDDRDARTGYLFYSFISFVYTDFSLPSVVGKTDGIASPVCPTVRRKGKGSGIGVSISVTSPIVTYTSVSRSLVPIIVYVAWMRMVIIIIITIIIVTVIIVVIIFVYWCRFPDFVWVYFSVLRLIVIVMWGVHGGPVMGR